MTTTGLILLLIAVVFWGYYARLSLKLEMERDELRHRLRVHMADRFWNEKADEAIARTRIKNNSVS